MLVRCMEFSLKLCRTGEYKKDVLRIVAPKMEIDEMEKLSKEELQKVLRNHAKSFVNCVLHPTGTAAMRPNDAGGVVDDHWKVYGASNLRVVRTLPYDLKMKCADETYFRWIFLLFQYF
jgi:choline dehydrogenase-like flavoprotein